jgi:4-hydroxy-4-methyl-2-oxoglutarate aldolase
VTQNSAFPSGPGEVGLPLALGEVMVEAGDLILGDPDGVVVVPRGALAEVTRRLEQVAAKEAELQALIGSGRILSLLERDPALERQITYLD